MEAGRGPAGGWSCHAGFGSLVVRRPAARCQGLCHRRAPLRTAAPARRRWPFSAASRPQVWLGRRGRLHWASEAHVCLNLQWQSRESVHVKQQLCSRLRPTSGQHVAGTRGHSTNAYRSAGLPAAPPPPRLGPHPVCLHGSMWLGVRVKVGSTCTGSHVGYLPARTTNNAAPFGANLERVAEHNQHATREAGPPSCPVDLRLLVLFLLCPRNPPSSARSLHTVR